MIPTVRISELIGQFYDAILEPERWAAGMEEFCNLVDAKAASIQTFNPREGSIGLYIQHGCDPAYTQSLMSTYAAMTPTGTSIFLAEIDEPMSVFAFIDESEFRDSRFYREWCVPQGYFDMVGTLFSKQLSEVGALSATRLESQPRFDAEAKELFSLLTPHIRRSIKIAGLLENKVREMEQLAGAIDQLQAAVLIVESSGRILRANGAGEDALAAGGPLRSSSGMLVVSDPALRLAIKTALERSPPQPALLPVAQPGEQQKLLAVMPLSATRRDFALFLKSEEPDIPAIGRHLVSAFQLTPREVGVLMPLLDGLSPTEVAEKLGIEISTVRTHLQKLFAKTGTQSQVELVARVLCSMPPVRLG